MLGLKTWVIFCTRASIGGSKFTNEEVPVLCCSIVDPDLHGSLSADVFGLDPVKTQTVGAGGMPQTLKLDNTYRPDKHGRIIGLVCLMGNSFPTFSYRCQGSNMVHFRRCP